MDYLFGINFFVCLPGSKIILMSQWQNEIYNSNVSVKPAQKQRQEAAKFLWARQERKDLILISVTDFSVFWEYFQETVEPIKYKERASRMSQPCNKWGNRLLAQAASCCIPTNSSSLAPWWCHTPGVRAASPTKWAQHWHQEHGRVPRTVRDSGEHLHQASIRIIQLKDTHASKPRRSSGWKGQTPLWHRQWEWQSWETGREKRETEKALGARFLQSYLHRGSCTGAQSTGLQFAGLFWVWLYKVLRRHTELIMINNRIYLYST